MKNKIEKKYKSYCHTKMGELAFSLGYPAIIYSKTNIQNAPSYAYVLENLVNLDVNMMHLNSMLLHGN